MNNTVSETSGDYLPEHDDSSIEQQTPKADNDVKTTISSEDSADEEADDYEGNESIDENREDDQAEDDAEHELITELNSQEHNIETMKDNSKTFEIRGLTFTKTPGNFLMCDHGNHSIKYVDPNFNVVNRYTVVYEPWDIAVVDEAYVIVTFPFVRLMQYFKFKNKSRLVPWFPVKAQNEYYGVCAGWDKIITTCKYNEETTSRVPSVHVLDRGGKVERVIDKDPKGEHLFKDPNHIALNSSTQVIYVSDQGLKEVISLSIAGTIFARFSSVHFDPRGVTVDDSNGNIFVSNNDSVIHFNCNLNKIQSIKCKEGNMRDLHALAYCSKTDRLIVNIDGSPFIRVFII